MAYKAYIFAAGATQKSKLHSLNESEDYLEHETKIN